MGRHATLLALALALAACTPSGDPFGLLGGGDDAPPPESRPAIERVESVALVPTSDGAVLTATGVAATQGYWDGVLVPVADGDPATLAYVFRAAAPDGPSAVSTPRSREVAVALDFDAADLAGIRQVTVTGATNALTARR